MLKILILDLETTGLDPVTDKILEVGWIQLSMQKSSLSIISSYSSVIGYDLDSLIMSNNVRKMHLETGLLDEVGQSKTSLSTVEEKLVEATSSDKWILTGNSIGFDRSFIKIHMPIAENNLHYRMIDTGNYPLLRKEMGKPVESLKLQAHRSLNDCFMSLSLLQRMIAEY